MKRFTNVAIVFLLVMGCLIWTSTEVSWAKEGQGDGIYPGSILYSFDRLGENLKGLFLTDEEQVEFYLQLALERFDEARYVFVKDDSDLAYELFKEGLANVGDALQAWQRLVAEDVEMENLKDDLRVVIEDAKDTFKELRKDLNLSRIGEISKEIGELVKEQVNIFLNMDKN